MTITIDLSKEVEDKLRKQALKKGVSVEKYIALLIVEDLDFPEKYSGQIVVKIID